MLRAQNRPERQKHDTALCLVLVIRIQSTEHSVQSSAECGWLDAQAMAVTHCRCKSVSLPTPTLGICSKPCKIQRCHTRTRASLGWEQRRDGLQGLTYNHVLDSLLTRGGTVLMPTLVLVQKDPSYYLTLMERWNISTPLRKNIIPVLSLPRG